MRKWLVLSLAVLSFFAVAPPGAQAYRGTVTIALTGEPPTMDPHETSNFIGSMVWRWSYDTLITSQTGTGKLEPWLATKWKKLSPTAYEFWLRKDATFSDGTPVNTDAVIFTMTRVLASAKQRPYFKSFDHIQKIDEHTFIWHTKVPDNGLINRLTRWAAPISLKVKNMNEAEISLHTFGCGPYILKSWDKGQKMVFEANPNWWANSKFPYRPKTVILRRIQEGSTRVDALLTGEVNIITGVMPQFISKIEKNPRLKIADVPAVRIMFMGFFTTHGGPFAKRKVRLAANYAIDANSIRKTILGGRADTFGQMLHPWNYSGYNPNKTWYGYNPAKAKTLLKEAGYPHGFKAVLLATYGRYPGDRPTCEAAAGMLTKVGIRTTCKAQVFPLYRKSFHAYQSGEEKGAAMYYMGFGNGGGEPALVLRGTTSCTGAWSGECFKDIDKAIDKAAATANPEKQQLAFEHVTDMMKQKVTHKIFFKIHDVFGYDKNLDFHPRHDETLYPWEITVIHLHN